MAVATLIASAPALAQAAEDISGVYEFQHENESIQLTVEHGRLDGYISRLGEEASDRGAPLTYFLKKARAQGTHVTFSTRQVHGIWYGFDGKVARGPGNVRDDAGYFVLQGRLTMHRIDRAKHDTAENGSVSFRSRRGSN